MKCLTLLTRICRLLNRVCAIYMVSYEISLRIGVLFEISQHSFNHLAVPLRCILNA